MKIFKNRGDIYISKSGYKSSKEERILLSLLAVIVIITVVFIVLLSKQYSSVADFFSSGEATTTPVAEIDDDYIPNIKGRANFVVMETDNENSVIHYIYLVQADGDSLAYKVTTLSPDMKLDKQSLLDIYLTGGGPAIQSQLTEYFGFQIDYFAQFKMEEFVEFANKFGSFIYPVSNDIKYDGGSAEDTYTLRLREGENKIDGKRLSNLLRYYSKDKPNFEASNELIMYALTGLFNESNYEKSEQLFRTFISNSSTNITVRDFENNKEKLMVFCKKSYDIQVYGAVAQYEKNELTKEANQNIKGYFSK